MSLLYFLSTVVFSDFCDVRMLSVLFLAQIVTVLREYIILLLLSICRCQYCKTGRVEDLHTFEITRVLEGKINKNQNK